MRKKEDEIVVSVTPIGTATIPKRFRNELGLEVPGHAKFVRKNDGEIVLQPTKSVEELRGTLRNKTNKKGKGPDELIQETKEPKEIIKEIINKSNKNVTDSG